MLLHFVVSFILFHTYIGSVLTNATTVLPRPEHFHLCLFAFAGILGMNTVVQPLLGHLTFYNDLDADAA